MNPQEVIAYGKVVNGKAVDVHAFYASLCIDSLVSFAQRKSMKNLGAFLANCFNSLEKMIFRYDDIDFLSYQAPIKVKDVNEVLDEDIAPIWIGRHHDIKEFERVAEATTTLYLKNVSFKRPQYTDVTSKVKDYLIQKYVVPMIDAANNNEAVELKKAQFNLVEFYLTAPFVVNAIRLARAIESGPTNVALIEPWIGKLAALHTEDYESAARYKAEIERLSLDKHA